MTCSKYGAQPGMVGPSGGSGPTPPTPPGGVDSSVQFNDNGSFGGDTGFVYSYDSGTEAREVTVSNPVATGSSAIVIKAGARASVEIDHSGYPRMVSYAGPWSIGTPTYGLRLSSVPPSTTRNSLLIAAPTGTTPQGDISQQIFSEWAPPVQPGAVGSVLTMVSADEAAWQPGGGGGTALNAAQSYPVGLASTITLPTQNMLYGSAFFSTATIANLTLGAFFCSQIGTGVAGIGIYSSTGVRLAYTDVAALTSGVNQRTLVAPVTLAAGTLYYFAYSSNVNGARILSYTGVTSTPLPSLGFLHPNPFTTDPTTGFPAVIPGLGTQTPERIWMAFGS